MNQRNINSSNLVFSLSWPPCMIVQLVLLASLSSQHACGATVFTQNSTVADDGSGNFTTIGAAVQAAPSFSSEKYVIYIKAGIYQENVFVDITKRNIVFLGDGADKTLISSNRSAADGIPTDHTSTLAIYGDGFIAKFLAIENTAGPSNGQAVAILSGSDKSAFYKCIFRGFQDTLYAKLGYQFYRECRVYGTVDFVFGDARAVFQSCIFLARKPLFGQANVVTAQGRETSDAATGFILQNCSILATPDLEPVKNAVSSFLGRPWKPYSKTVVMQSFIDDLIHSSGWLQWNSTSPLDKLFYAEFRNRGPGANTTKRVHWPGYKMIQSFDDAAQFTVRNFLDGHNWIPSTAIPFVADFF